MTSIGGQREKFRDSIFKSEVTLNKKEKLLSSLDWNTKTVQKADIECSLAGMTNLPKEGHIIRCRLARWPQSNTFICKHDIRFTFIYESCHIIFCRPIILCVSDCIIENFQVNMGRRYFPRGSHFGQSCRNAGASKLFMATGYIPHCGLVRGEITVNGTPDCLNYLYFNSVYAIYWCGRWPHHSTWRNAVWRRMI
jgi:hypothetical protein